MRRLLSIGSTLAACVTFAGCVQWLVNLVDADAGVVDVTACLVLMVGASLYLAVKTDRRMS